MDLSTIEALYRRHGPQVLRRARRILRDEHLAKDAVQEVFIRALRSGSEFRHEASPVTWLYRVTTHLCLNTLRDGTRQRQLLDLRGGAAQEPAAPMLDERLSLTQVLRTVDPELCEVAIYYYLDELNQDEIAEVLGVSRRTVGNRLESFRAAARAVLGEASGV